MKIKLIQLGGRMTYFIGRSIILACCLLFWTQPVLLNTQFNNQTIYTPPESELLARMFNRIADGLVICYSDNNTTTGFFVSKNGWIITVKHKVNQDFPEANQIHVKLGRTQKSMVFKSTEIIIPFDAQLDLLLFKINYKPKYYFNSFRKPYLYEENWIFGFRGTSGKVPSAPGYITNYFQDPRYLLTTASIYFGNSGSPIVNRTGDVLGIGVRMTSNFDGLFIPGDIVKAFIKEGLKDKK